MGHLLALPGLPLPLDRLAGIVVLGGDRVSSQGSAVGVSGWFAENVRSDTLAVAPACLRTRDRGRPPYKEGIDMAHGSAS